MILGKNRYIYTFLKYISSIWQKVQKENTEFKPFLAKLKINLL